MVIHTCEKCNKEFNKISHYKTHINKKIPCNNNLDKSLKSKRPKKLDEKIEKVNKNKCSHCLKIFSSISNLNKHIKNNCKIIKQKNTINNNIEPNMTKMMTKIIEQNVILIKENKKLQKITKNKNIKNQQINNIKNQQNNQINVNINVYDHGTEKLDLIDNKVILNAINKGMGVSHITNIIESIYLNPELPKYQNICITDINRQKCMVFSKNQWILSDIEKIYNLISKVIDFSKEKYDEFVELYETNKNFRNKLEIFKKYLDFCDSEYLDDLNNDDITKENREKIERCKQLTEKLENDVIKLFYNSKGIALKKSSNLIL
jgi:thiol-disulfide isomerase/thioredoxin